MVSRLIKHSAVFITLAAALAAPAMAVTTYTTSLLSVNQVPPVRSSATGMGTLTLASDNNSFTILLNYSNLSSAIDGAHVHCCAPPTADAPVAVEFTLPDGKPVSGTITGTYDLTLASTYTLEFLQAYGDTVASAHTAFVNGLTNGLAYLNVHSVQFPDGEIRGQLPAASGVGAVPEPASWALMITGFVFVGGAMRRRAATTLTA